VVDALALRAQLGPALAGVLSDPAVVKVLHGADRDVLWLQVGLRWVWRALRRRGCWQKAATRGFADGRVTGRCLKWIHKQRFGAVFRAQVCVWSMRCV
jgi:hypothetical protein